ncbi:MAG: PAS domain S-box protein [Verrucomicrobiales bacterium]|nr:PAS domain S-box protein [Verrucomicrobiales bacterium]
MQIPEVKEILSDVEIGNEQFRLLVEASPFGILIAGSDERIVVANQFAEKLAGYGRDEMRGLSVAKVVKGGLPVSPAKPGDASKIDALATPLEGCVRHRGGNLIPVEISLSALPCGGRLYVLATLTDISEKRKIEGQLAFLADVMERLYEAVVFLDEEGYICFWNSGASSMFGAEGNEVMGAAVDDIIRLGRQLTFREDLVPRIQRSGRFEQSINCLDLSNQSKRIRLKGASVNWGDRKGSIWLANDITREARLEAEIVKVAENEQRRIGQDIHDDLSSQLAAIGCLVEVLEQQVTDRDSEEARSLGKIAEMICVAGETARSIAVGLAPAAMNGDSFVGAVRALVETRRVASSPKFILTVRNESLLDRLEEERATHLYRIVQEAIHNAIKHSGASEIRIELSADHSSIRLIVLDSGSGFDCQSRGSGMGLSTMKHRIGLLGGRLEISSSPDDGTQVVCVVPLQE